MGALIKDFMGLVSMFVISAVVGAGLTLGGVITAVLLKKWIFNE